MQEISNIIFDKYRKQIQQKGIESVPEPERTLIAVYTAQGIIDNGGLGYFFENDFYGESPYSVIIQSFYNIGLGYQADGIKKALDLFPMSTPHKDKKKREDFIYKYFSGDDLDNYLEIIEEIEGAFFKESEKAYFLADQYVREIGLGES